MSESHQKELLKAIKILIVDDSLMVRKSVTNSLSSLVEICSAKSGEEALTTLLNTPNQKWLVLSDIYMTQGDGFWLLSRIADHKASGQIRDVDVVIWTTARDADAMVTSKKLGAVGFMVKPYDMEKLRSLVIHMAKRCLIPSTANQKIAS